MLACSGNMAETQPCTHTCEHTQGMHIHTHTLGMHEHTRDMHMGVCTHAVGGRGAQHGLAPSHV